MVFGFNFESNKIQKLSLTIITAIFAFLIAASGWPLVFPAFIRSLSNAPSRQIVINVTNQGAGGTLFAAAILTLEKTAKICHILAKEPIRQILQMMKLCQATMRFHGPVIDHS